MRDNVVTDGIAEKLFYYTFKVQGRGPFPCDMMRTDRCWAADGDTLPSEYSSDVITIKMATWQRQKYWEPTVGRWSSFGWSVVPVENYKY